MEEIFSFTDAINMAMIDAMQKDPDVLCFGLGVDDPKRIFGTTKNLKEIFGPNRVWDMPTSENTMTGVAIGASLNGLKPVMVHQRLDFFLLAIDQLVNNAAKWHYMFGGKKSVPITIRLIQGRGWGQGPTHSQTLQSWFAHIPGLKVMEPTNPHDAYHMLLESISDPNPVLFYEHRWLHNSTGMVDKKNPTSTGKAVICSRGTDVTIVANSFGVAEAKFACVELNKFGIYPELIDLRYLNPIDWDTIYQSVEKTRSILVIEPDHTTCSISSEIIASVCEKFSSHLKNNPCRLGLPNHPIPTSYGLTRNLYPDHQDIVKTVTTLLNISPITIPDKRIHHDIPDPLFTGPF